MITKTVEVLQIVEVTVDETKFTPEWMQSFRETFYSFDSLNEHLEHLGQLAAREMIYQPQVTNQFIEGYGNASDMGIATRVTDTTAEVTK